jgi:predicted nucleic acid-binding protein
VFDDPAVAPVKAAVEKGEAEVVVNESVTAELARVLGYPFGARTLDAQAQANAIAQCLRVARKEEVGRREAEVLLPKCSDPDDQKFLELALACGANFLLTRDDALLVLARGKTRPLPFRIVTPQEFAVILDASAGQKC